MKPGRGVIAICSRGYIGLITEDEPKEIEYPDGNKGVAWVGVQLTDKPPFTEGYTGTTGIGAPWSSRTPKCILHVDAIEEFDAIVQMSKIGRMRDLSEEERAEFAEFVKDRVRPFLEDVPKEDQDGYFVRHYKAWKFKKEEEKA